MNNIEVTSKPQQENMHIFNKEAMKEQNPNDKVLKPIDKGYSSFNGMEDLNGLDTSWVLPWETDKPRKVAKNDQPSKKENTFHIEKAKEVNNNKTEKFETKSNSTNDEYFIPQQTLSQSIPVFMSLEQELMFNLGPSQLKKANQRFMTKSKAQYPIKYKKISTGEQYAYQNSQIRSSKRTIVLLHGNITGVVNMEAIMIQLERKFNLIAPYLRGYGNSSLNKPVKSFEDLAEDVYSFMNERFPNIENYHIFGHDFGAIVAMKLELLHPKKVRGITILSPAPPGGKKEENTNSNCLDDLNQLKHKEFLEDLINKKSWVVDKPMLDYYEATPELQFSKYSLKQQIHFKEMELLQENLDMTDELKNIKCPVKLVYGLNDTSFNVEDGCFIQQVFEGNCQLTAVQDCGHFAHTEQPEQVAAILQEFITKTGFNKNWQEELSKMYEEVKVKQPKIVKQPSMVDKILTNANKFANKANKFTSKARKMVGPIFNGGLVRERLEDMLTFKEDTMFRPQFIGDFAFN